jgi:hypothetical protein
MCLAELAGSLGREAQSKRAKETVSILANEFCANDSLNKARLRLY